MSDDHGSTVTAINTDASQKFGNAVLTEAPQAGLAQDAKAETVAMETAGRGSAAEAKAEKEKGDAAQAAAKGGQGAGCAKGGAQGAAGIATRP